jgi:hypothetical protein
MGCILKCITIYIGTGLVNIAAVRSDVSSITAADSSHDH